MSVEVVANNYFQAWEDRDLDAIIALHAPNTIFQSHTGQPPVTGAEQVRAVFAQVLLTTPDIAFKAWDLRFGHDFWVAQLIVTGTRLQSNGSRAPFAANSTDVVHVTDGLILRKDTYFNQTQFMSESGRTAS